MGTFIDKIKTDLILKYTAYKSATNRSDLKEALNDNEQKLLAELKQNGVVLIENYYTQEQCARLRELIDQNIEKNADKIWVDKFGADHRIWGAEELAPEFKAFAEDKFFHKMCQAYLGNEIENLIMLANRIQPKEGNLGSGQGWHRDSVHNYQFKSIMYLSDVEVNNGPFEYLLGTHDKQSIKDSIKQCGVGYDQYRFTEEKVAEIEQKLNFKHNTWTAKAGTLALVDTSNIHRGMPIQEGMRYALFNYFYPKYLLNPKLRDKFNSMRVSAK